MQGHCGEWWALHQLRPSSSLWEVTGIPRMHSDWRHRWQELALTLDLTAKMILGRATMRHLRAMVIYFSRKSAIPTIHSRSKKSSVSRLGFRNMRLGAFTEPSHSFRPGPWQLSLTGEPGKCHQEKARQPWCHIPVACFSICY